LPVEKHSKKPDKFRQMIDAVTGNFNNKIELFARNKYKGWDAWGNEIGEEIFNKSFSPQTLFGD